MSNIRFVKSFSKGQITIPKDLRDELGIRGEFWLKLYAQNGKIIAEPVAEEKQLSQEEYLKLLLNISTVVDLEPEIKRNREQIEKRLKNNKW